MPDEIKESAKEGYPFCPACGEDWTTHPWDGMNWTCTLEEKVAKPISMGLDEPS